MTLLLESLLAGSTTLLVLSTVALFLPMARRRRTPVDAAVAALAAVATAVAAPLALDRPTHTWVVAAVVAVAVAVALVRHRDWAARGAVAWAALLLAGASYLAAVVAWTLTGPLGLTGQLAGGLLLLVEVFVFVIAIGYGYELVDVLARRVWRRRVDLDAADRTHRPFVSLHVPAHHEPPDMVIRTLTALLELDYDDYEILMVDDNTADEALWRPVEEFCAGHDRIRFVHLEDWPGYKSGALNHALSITDPRAEVVGVVDADYLVRPDFLARCAPLFADDAVSFVQTPQDYREWEQAPYFRRLYHSYRYFFDVSQRSRDEVDAAIFGGTMGLIRRSELDAVGGWDEWCITEDAELSLRLLKRGGSGLHVDESFGHGLMPLTFEALKRQRFRWCFGGVQILRLHWRDLLPGRRTETNRLTFAQRWAYFVGGLQWYGDVASLLFTGFLVAGALDAALGEGLVVRRVSGLVLLCMAALVVIGVARSLALLRRARGVTLGDAFGPLGIWLGLGWAVALGCLRGSLAREGAFLRTPKTRGDVGWRDAVRGNRVEVALAVVALTVAVLALSRGTWSTTLLGVLLVWQGGGHAMALVNSLAAIRAEIPVELRRRRADRFVSWAASAPVRRAVLVPAGVLTVGAAALVLTSAPANGPRLPSDWGPEEPAVVVRPSPVSPDPTGAPSVRSTSPSPAAAALAGAASGTPTAVPSAAARPQPTSRPTARPTAGPTARPTARPTAAPTQAAPSATARPTARPTQAQTGRPTAGPTTRATPTRKPTATPTRRPTAKPTQAGGPASPTARP